MNGYPADWAQLTPTQKREYRLHPIREIRSFFRNSKCSRNKNGNSHHNVPIVRAEVVLPPHIHGCRCQAEEVSSHPKCIRAPSNYDYLNRGILENERPWCFRFWWKFQQ